MRRPDLVRAITREIPILAFVVIVLLLALAQQRPERACGETQLETRP
ncbi:hypothetical protein [Sphingomonas pituitosa]|nr:hypothetical protein [Sphingomonas pituitosa]